MISFQVRGFRDLLEPDMARDGDTKTRDQLADLETELEKLEAAVQRCRKTTLAARVAVVAGPVPRIIAFWRSDPTLLVTGIAALLGGLALPDRHERPGTR